MSGRIPDEFIRDVLDRTNMVELIGTYIGLKRSGTGFKGLCPFHKEKTPSFQVHPDRGFYYCFGCGKGGDAVRFLMDMHGLSFPEGVISLAERMGMVLPETYDDGPKWQESRTNRKTLIEAMAAAQDFFVEEGRKGEILASFCQQRGLTGKPVADEPSVAEQFGLGLAPDGWDHLTNYLRRKGFSPDIAEEAGLLIPRNEGSGYYDRFRNRIMFPIRDLGGRIVAFSGRTLSNDPKAAKYVNSPETPLYRKSKLLYGITQARDTIRQKETTILVEGNVDVARLHAAGLRQTVAALGTALTSEQASVIARFAPSTTLFYDGDSAGAKATLRAIPLLLAAGLDVRVARPPEDKDPADLAEEGQDALEQVLAAAMPSHHYVVQNLQQTLGRSPAASGQILSQALAIVAQIPEEASARKAAWNIYRLLGLDRGVTDSELNSRLFRERTKVQRKEERAIEREEEAPAESEEVHISPLAGSERHMGALLLAFPEFAARFVDDGGIGLLTHPQLAHLIEGLAGTTNHPAPESAVNRLKADLVFSTPISVEENETERVYLQLWEQMEKNHLERRSLSLNPEIDLAESTGDSASLARLRREKLDIRRRIRELESTNYPNTTQTN